MTSSDSVWVVLKFGGSSVSSAPNWRNIRDIANHRLETGDHVLIIHSALSGVTDRLEKALVAACEDRYSLIVDDLRQRHIELASSLGVDGRALLESSFLTLSSLLSGVSAKGAADNRTRAQVMAFGELLSTMIGAQFLRQSGLPAFWVDARDYLKAESREAATVQAEYLSATCNFSPNVEVQARLASRGRLVLTQGFIASNARGETVLLGRGGSDTSSAYFAAMLGAKQLEIWTDVPGMFSANPRSTPGARQLLELTYDEAQEVATAGAKVLHPRCLLPAREHSIPIFVFATQAPNMQGTRISANPPSDAAQVKAVCVKKGVTLISLESPGMWHEVGFLADAFQIFKRHGLSVDLVSTSETNVTVSLDPQANAIDPLVLQTLKADLALLCRAEIIGSCASVSLVGRNIRSILHQLGPALELFAEQRIYLVSQAANDLNLTFVVDEGQGDRLVEDLHHLLVDPVRDDVVLGPTWRQLFETSAETQAVAAPWWVGKRARLLSLMSDRDAAYVYDLGTVRERCQRLKALRAIDRVSYAMKANPHPAILQVAHANGLFIECVSRGEVEHALLTLPSLLPQDVLFTPNFATRDEYAWALSRGVQVTLDNLYPLERWPELFAGRDIFIRLDPGMGRGHHAHVRTGGTQSKFGVARGEIDALISASAKAGARVVGLHAHTGSGVFDVDNWRDTGNYLAGLLRVFPDVRVIDLGGGIGVPDRPGAPEFDFTAFDDALLQLKSTLTNVSLWIEPGRFVVAEAGVLLAKVTQIKGKGDASFVGVATGMNSLIRPALYGAHHVIVNLTQISEPDMMICDVVGPICETGDVLGHARSLPRVTSEGDVLLIATAGAYGASMSSNYNLRSPAEECVLEL
ncbi:MAG: bifunctional aspartate kinase/diaminopimelate decarboxylase [Gammaproteobacteria bacterium]|nr:bifunctional aspartate kinase/diaminopimelate decarboxylase [Gammaproteobacteria bacterium]